MRATLRRRQVRRIAIAVAAVLFAIPASSLGRVLLADNTDPLGVRTIEWARDHHLGGLVNSIENLWYSHHPPKRGGSPKAGLPTAPTPHVVAVAARQRSGRFHDRRPPDITPFVADPLPGEGVWTPVGRTQHGISVAWVTYLRPDAVHTSEVAAVVHFDMRHTRATLHAGTQLPGGSGWRYGARIDRADYPRVVGAFNSAFKLKGSRGGYYAQGRTVAPLVDGRASLVTYTDGHADVALWGRDASMSPDVTAVRQNLGLLVDNGVLPPNLGADSLWGGTLGGNVYVWRSAVCVDARGDLDYAAGPGLNVLSLAQLMVHIGCVRAMELDINSEWVSAMLFADDGRGGVTPFKLLPSMERPADRYLVNGTRDFIEIDLA